MNKLLFVSGAGKVSFVLCMFEMKSADDREVRQARNRNEHHQQLAGPADRS